MMRYIVILNVFFTSIGYAQESEFESLVELFAESKKVIPEDVALKYFEFTSSERANELLTNGIIIKTDRYVLLSTRFDCNAEGVCEQSTLTSFTVDGKRIDKIDFERAMADCSFDDTRASVFISKDLLVFKETREKLDCQGDGKQIGKKIWLEFQPIKEDGTFSKPYIDRKASERENFIFSHRMFSITELDGKTEEELAIIKNEIFASHGYMFKTKKWQDYFESKSWYIPTTGDAVNKLSTIERKNIELILSIKQ
ncbi:YARHG domain-containing protein [Aquimarina sp. 2201CG14-23]|uniref:YARHG domain-containing protein n=1 Tax=Aquimarina mycalae TaxID=3040073 RepID=UPI002477FB22|nr:YARHG domain-containing protein [Aquimarina sp. 2201CG14-23]MDH7444365.1 YARHG domain-containing protein [Aquimarina sp. 2201CG14-23]